MADAFRVPSYEPMLAAYHRAFAADLRAMVGSLPIAQGQSVLDMACGDGVYAPWLAEMVGPAGRVVCVDLLPEYLELARRESKKAPLSGVIEFASGSIDALPFANDTFDLAWCAQSLYSLPEPLDTLRELVRVTKPGGFVAVLEADTLHHLILPWPIEVELAVRVAEMRALAAMSDHPRKFYVGRNLRRVLRRAGMEAIEARTWATDRHAPLDGDVRAYLTEVLKRLRDRVAEGLPEATRARFKGLTDPDSEEFFLDDPDFAMTCIDEVAWGRKPMGKS